MPLSLSPLQGVTLIWRSRSGSVEPLAKFLLDAMVHALRLDIQIDREQDDEGQDHNSSEEPEQEAAEFLHRVKLRQPRLKKR